MKDLAAHCTFREMKEIRCKKCKRLLMKGEVRHIEIKCPKCGYIQKIRKEAIETANKKHL